MSETVLNPVVIQNLTSNEQDLQEFVIQVRQKTNHSVLWEKTTPGYRSGIGWKSTPCVFDQTVKGVAYEARAAIRKHSGNLSRYSGWAAITVGDTTPPTSIGTITATAKEGAVVFSFTYTKPIDFVRFEWKVNIDTNTEPSDDDIFTTTTDPQLVVASTADDIIYIWVRAVDLSGNTSAWVAQNGTVSKVHVNRVKDTTSKTFVTDSEKTGAGNAYSHLDSSGLKTGAAIGDAIKQTVLWSDYNIVRTAGVSVVANAPILENTEGYIRKAIAIYTHDSDVKSLTLKAQMKTDVGISMTGYMRLSLYKITTTGGFGTNIGNSTAATISSTTYAERKTTLTLSGLNQDKMYYATIEMQVSTGANPDNVRVLNPVITYEGV